MTKLSMWPAAGWLAACLAFGSLTSGCAMGLAEKRAVREYSGHPTALPAPDLGTPRAQVRSSIGLPQESYGCADGGSADAYAYRAVSAMAVAADRTAAGVRSFAHAFLTGATFFLWDLVGYPLEQAIQRATTPEPKPYVLVVRYDAAERVVDVRRERAEAASPAAAGADCSVASPAGPGGTTLSAGR
jgi:hypothetical protein